MVPEDKRKEYLSTLRTEANRLGYLVENVLAYAQIERGRKRKPLEELQAGELLERIVPRLRERAGPRLEIAPTPPCIVKADRISVEQILFNLVDNASRYGGERISLQSALANGALVISVADEGPGVAPEVERKLFQPLRKSAAEAADGAQGIGLGLALSRRLARAMGGELRYVRGKGATFELTLALR
jgi:signal transduction histidine kinase